jgi:hypothetical protein
VKHESRNSGETTPASVLSACGKCRENINLIEFSGRPLTAKKARTRFKGAHTGFTNATDEIMQAHAMGLLSDQAVREIVEPRLTELEALVSSKTHT